MASPVDICNLALGQLGAERITSFENPKTPNEQLCALYYPIVRDTLLERYEWSFIVARATLTVFENPPPDWGWSHAFPVPADNFRIVEVRRNNLDNRPSDFKWRLENGKILANQNTIYVRYIKRDVPTTTYSTMFVMAIAKKLAAEMCVQITENRALRNDLSIDAEDYLIDSITSDNMQGSGERIYASELTNARAGSGSNLTRGI